MANQSVFVEVLADRDIRYGALYLRDCGDYCDFVEVIDLDSATGTTGMVLVESGSVGFYARSLGDMRSQLDGALSYTSGRQVLLEADSREWRRLIAWEALHAYKGGDIEESHVIRTDADAPLDQPDYGFRASMTFASECELRRWLFQNFDVPAHEDCDHHCPDCGETFGSRAHEVAHSADVDTADRDELEAAAAIYDETAS